MQWCQHLDADYGVDPWIWQSLHGLSFHLSSKLCLCNSLGIVSTLQSSFFLSFMCLANCTLYLGNQVLKPFSLGSKRVPRYMLSFSCYILFSGYEWVQQHQSITCCIRILKMKMFDSIQKTCMNGNSKEFSPYHH